MTGWCDRKDLKLYYVYPAGYPRLSYAYLNLPYIMKDKPKLTGGTTDFVEVEFSLYEKGEMSKTEKDLRRKLDALMIERSELVQEILDHPRKIKELERTIKVLRRG